MLPQKINDLVDGFVRVYDLEHSITIELRKAHNRAAVLLQESGRKYSIDGLVLYLGKNLIVFLEARVKFLWDKLKQVVTSTEIQCYPELNADLKSKFASYYNPARQAAENYLEQMRQSANMPTDYTVETKATFNNILLKTNAEIDLFCEECAAEEKRTNQSRGVIEQNIELKQTQEKAPSTFEEGLLLGIWNSRFKWFIVGAVILAITTFAIYTAQPIRS